MFGKLTKSFLVIKLMLTLLVLSASLNLACTLKPVPIQPPAPAAFQITKLSITPIKVKPGEEVVIEAEISNTGGTEGMYSVTLTIDGVETQTGVIKLAPGTTEMVTFSLAKDEVGTYNIKLDGLAGTLIVEPVVGLHDEVRLDVPFEPNVGGSCFSSSFAPVMRYCGKIVTVHDVLKIVGYPPFRGYEHPELRDWMENNYGLTFKYMPYSKIEDVKKFLNEGYPVIVHQTFSLGNNTGHNRVVIGYSDKQCVFIVNDPSYLGPNFKISYDDFGTLWKRITLYESGPENKAYLVIPLK